MSISGREADGAGEAVHRDGREREGSEDPVAALPGLAQSPALRRAVRKQRARELVARATRVAVVMPLTGTSTEESVQLPSPSCPNWFRPVHCAVPSGQAHARVFAAG